MKKKTDDLLNKYIDNELDSSELAELNDLIDKDELALKELKAMKMVEQSLRKMEFENSPSNVTYNVMQKIASVKKAKKSNWFFWFVVSFFLLGIAAATFYALQSYHPAANEIVSDKSLDTVKNLVGNTTQSLDSFFKDVNVKLIGTILTLLFAVTGYFIFETHRSFRNKLKSL